MWSGRLAQDADPKGDARNSTISANCPALVAKCCSPALSSNSTASASFMEAACNSSIAAHGTLRQKAYTVRLVDGGTLFKHEGLIAPVLARCPRRPPPAVMPIPEKIWPRLCISVPGLSFWQRLATSPPLVFSGPLMRGARTPKGSIRFTETRRQSEVSRAKLRETKLLRSMLQQARTTTKPIAKSRATYSPVNRALWLDTGVSGAAFVDV